MLNVPISIDEIDHSHRISFASSPQPSAPDNQAAVTNPGPQAPAGEVPSVAGTTEGNVGDSDGQSNNAKRAEGSLLNRTSYIWQTNHQDVSSWSNLRITVQEMWCSGRSQNLKHIMQKKTIGKSLSMKIWQNFGQIYASKPGNWNHISCAKFGLMLAEFWYKMLDTVSTW